MREGALAVDLPEPAPDRIALIRGELIGTLGDTTLGDPMPGVVGGLDAADEPSGQAQKNGQPDAANTGPSARFPARPQTRVRCP